MIEGIQRSHWSKRSNHPSALPYTQGGEGLRPKEIIIDEKATWILTWQTMDNVSWSGRLCVRPTSKTWA